MFRKIKSYFIQGALDKTNDVFVKSQIELTFQLILIWIGMLGLLVVSYAPLPVSWHFMLVHYFFWGWIIASLPVFRITKSHKVAGTFVVLTLTGVTLLMLFYFHGMQSAETSLWYMFITIIAFILLGKRWGWTIGLLFLVTLLVGLLNINFGWNLFDVGLEVGYDLESDPISHAIPMVLGIYSLSHFLKTRAKAQQVISEQKEKVEEAHKEIKDSISYAKRIQGAILPSDKLIKEQLPDSFVLYLPKDVVAGDFYWMEKVNDLTIFAVADCTGHGVPGAMVSVVCNNALNRSVREFGLIEPAKILDKTRELVIEEFAQSEEDVKDGMDISLCALNTKTKQLHWAGANNPLWIVTNCQSELVEDSDNSGWSILREPQNDSPCILEIKADKQPIGKFDLLSPFTNHVVQLAAGDRLFIFSDGFADQFGGEKGKKYKSGKFKKTLLSLADKPMEICVSLLQTELENWRGDIEQVDDVCIIGVRV